MIRGLFRRWRGPAVRIAQERWRQVESGLPFLGHLAPEERVRLRQLALELIAEKEWHGARGLVLTEAVQLSIALQACLPVLKLGLDWYRGWLGIVVYPGDFVIPRQVMDDAGFVHEYDDTVLGEAWEGGPVLLSWFDEADEAGGINIVIHEFAHKLDMKSGPADGLPPLHPGMSRRLWIGAFAAAFEDFRACVDSREETVLDPYGAESPAEFFAVMSEAFFENPSLLHDQYPDVYEQLRLFYRQDPGH